MQYVILWDKDENRVLASGSSVQELDYNKMWSGLDTEGHFVHYDMTPTDQSGNSFKLSRI